MIFFFVILSIILLIFNDSFINYIDEYSISINNSNILVIVNFIIKFNMLNIKQSHNSLQLLVLFILITILLIIFFLLSIYIKFFRLPLIYISSCTFNFFLNISSNYLLDVNNIIKYLGITIEKKLSDLDKLQLFYNFKDKYLLNLDQNAFLDYCLNNEKIFLLLTDCKDINQIDLLSKKFIEILIYNTYYLEESINYNYLIVPFFIVSLSLLTGIFIYSLITKTNELSDNMVLLNDVVKNFILPELKKPESDIKKLNISIHDITESLNNLKETSEKNVADIVMLSKSSEEAQS